MEFLTVFEKSDKIAPNVPLCSVEVPRNSGPIVTKSAQELAGESLEIAHQRLGVPDPEDLEINVIEGKGDQAKILVSYTVGPKEYPDFPNPSFNPTDEQVNQAGREIHLKASQGSLEVNQTTLEAWKNTTFILRDPEASELIPPNEELKDELKEVGFSIESPQLRLIVSPEKMKAPVALPRETEPTTEPEPNLKFIERVGRKLSEALGLSESTSVPVHVQPALFADTDFAVEFDCQPVSSGYQISERARTYMAQLIEQELNRNPATKDGSAEVWVRQGRPTRHHFAGK